MLGYIKHTHDDVPGVRYDQNRAEGLEYPFEEHPGIHVVHIVAVNQHLDQIEAHNEG